MPGEEDYEGLEERIEAIEELLSRVLERLERIEEMLRAAGGEEALIAARLALAFSMPALNAIEAARRIVAATRGSRLDPISRSIVEALAECRPMSISEITRRVKALRGSASRTTVRSRIRRLVEEGVVVRVDEGRRPLYTLSTCRERGGP
ncbi:MAG: winged helix-turn-helix transcriptional regulator [Crenarchaeota archaeon]|nr:winged helix-turn-helix transcriptional regulator [Thermoproteota archaeon]